MSDKKDYEFNPEASRFLYNLDTPLPEGFSAFSPEKKLEASFRTLNGQQHDTKTLMELARTLDVQGFKSVPAQVAGGGPLPVDIAAEDVILWLRERLHWYNDAVQMLMAELQSKDTPNPAVVSEPLHVPV